MFKHHYIIENMDEYNVAKKRSKPVSIIAESNSRSRIFTTISIPRGTLNSNTSNIPSPQPLMQPLATNFQFRKLKNRT